MESEWHPEDIKAAIRKRGKSMAALARDNDVSPRSIAEALKSPCKTAELVISDFINVPTHVLWPDRWTEDGQRIYPRYAYLHMQSET